MLATRALLEAGAALGSPHRHALDDRRGDRQRVVARGDRGRGAAERRRARAGAVAARRRGEDVAERLRLVSARSSAAWPRTPASSRRRARAPSRSWRTRFCASTRCRISARGVSVNVVQVSGGLRSNVIPDEARAIVDVRVPTAAAAAEKSTPPFAPCAPSTAARRSRRAAASTVRRWNAPTWSSVCTNRRAMSRGSSVWIWPKAAPAADRTGISPPRSGFRR